MIPAATILGFVTLAASALFARRAATIPQRAAIFCLSAGGVATGALLVATEAGHHLDASAWLFATSLTLALLARVARNPHPTPAAQEHALP